MEKIANLYRLGYEPKHAERVYGRFLSKLRRAAQTKRIVEVCRQIRRFAAASRCKEEDGFFTYFEEWLALNDAGDFRSMWRSLRNHEKALFGKRLDLDRRRWKPEDTEVLLFRYGPLLYLLGRYRLAYKLFNAAFRLIAKRTRHQWSFDRLGHVYKGTDEPSSVYGATLFHVYRAMGKTLDEWPHWSQFVDGFHPRLFRRSGVTREMLRADPGLLEHFVTWISEEHRRRLFSGTTSGESDLTQSEASVRERQASTAAKIEAVRQELALTQEQRDRELLALFPEIAALTPSKRRKGRS